jgi:hypothetical protein
MEAQANSLLSPITAAADRSETTTMLVSEGSGLPRILRQAARAAGPALYRPPGTPTAVAGQDRQRGLQLWQV